MKILWIIHGYVPVLNAGAERYAHNLNKYLITQGHQIKVILPKKYSNYENNDMVFEGVQIYASITEAEERNKLVEWCDIVFTHLDYTNITINYINNNRPIVWVSHNTFFDSYLYLNNHPNVFMIFNSNKMKEISVPYFSNLSFVLHPSIVLKSLTTEPKHNKYITLINCNKSKGGKILNHLAELMPKYSFMAVTGGYAEQIEQPKHVLQMPHTNNIEEIYEKTRIILMPSDYESWGMVASEAMANGIPVIANKTFGLEENLGEAGIFCDLQNINKWKNSISLLMNDNIYAAQSEKCKKRAKEQTETNKKELSMCVFFLFKIINIFNNNNI